MESTLMESISRENRQSYWSQSINKPLRNTRRQPINTLCPKCQGTCLDCSMMYCSECKNKGYIFHPENLFGDAVCPACKGSCLNHSMMYCPTCQNKGFIPSKRSDILKRRLL